jgi:integrase
MLTDVALRKIKPTGKTMRLFDGGGMYLEVSPAGGRWWRLKYRVAGKEKRLSLGTYPDVGLKDARARRDDARKLLASGVDPSDHRRATRAASIESAANSFEVIAREWYDKHSPTWAPNHSRRVLRLFERDIFPQIGAKPIGAVTSPELLVVLRRIEAREAVDTAHRARGTCGQVFRYAIATGRAERDPSADLRGALPPVTGGHFASVTDPARVGELLRILAGYRGTSVVGAALRLAPLVFVRPGELRTARWKDIDLDKAEWRFTTSKTETAHLVPLSRQAVAILREMQPVSGAGTFVFPSARSPSRPMSDNAVLAALRRMEVDKEEMSGHGFRAMARTILDEVLSFRPDLIEHQLGHSVRDPHGRAYNRTTFLEERREMMQAWANYLDGLRTQVPDPRPPDTARSTVRPS